MKFKISLRDFKRAVARQILKSVTAPLTSNLTTLMCVSGLDLRGLAAFPGSLLCFLNLIKGHLTIFLSKTVCLDGDLLNDEPADRNYPHDFWHSSPQVLACQHTNDNSKKENYYVI